MQRRGFPGGKGAQWQRTRLQCKSAGVPSLGREDPLEEEMAPTPVFLPGESHGQRSLVGYSPRGCKESDTTEHTHTHNAAAAYAEDTLVSHWAARRTELRQRGGGDRDKFPHHVRVFYQRELPQQEEPPSPGVIRKGTKLCCWRYLHGMSG